MCREEIGDEELKEFADGLAALVPRADRLDPRFPAFLETEAALTAELAAAQRGGLSVCAYCGRGGPAAGRRRWAWPAAFSAMTTTAAALLLLLLMRPQPQVVERITPPEAVPAASVAGKTPQGNQDEQDISSAAAADEPALFAEQWPRFASRSMQPTGNPAWDQFQRLRWRHQQPGSLAAADADLLDQLLAPRPAWQAPRHSGPVVLNDVRKSPPSQRELLEQMLKER